MNKIIKESDSKEIELESIIDEQKTVICKLKEKLAYSEIAYSKVYQKYVWAINDRKNMELEVQKKREIETELQNTKQMLEFVMNTRSYRITAPLRAITRFFRRWISL